MLKNIIILFVLIILFGGCSSRNVQKPEPAVNTEIVNYQPDKKKAMEHFIQGNVAEQKGDYELAIQEYQDALIYDNKPGLYYAIAKDYYQINKLSLALKNISQAVKMDSSNIDYLDLMANIYQSAQQGDSAAAAYEQIIKLDSTRTNAYYNLALIYEQSKPTEAIRTYDKLTNLIGPVWDVLARKAELYERLGKYDDAIKSVEGLLAIDPSNTNLQKLLLESYIKTGKNDTALAKINTLLLQYPDDADLLEKKAQILIEQNKWQEAAEEYKLLIARPGINIDSKIKIGTAFLAQSTKDSGLIKQAEDIFKILDKDTTYWQVKVMLGEVYLLEKNDSTAFRYFRKGIELANWNADAWVRLGGLYFDRRKYQDAENLMKDAVIKFPNNFAINFILGLALSQQNKFSDASEYLKRSVDLNSKDLNALSAYGYALNQMKKPDEAIYYLKEALKISPDNVELLGTLGLIYNAQKRWKECDSTYKRALDIDSSNALVLNNYAYALSERGEDLNKALTMAEKAVAKDSLNSSYLDTIGWVFYQLKNYRKAELYIEKALEFDKKNATILEHLGDIKFRKGNKEAAVDLWKKAYNLDSDNQELKLKLDKGEM